MFKTLKRRARRGAIHGMGRVKRDTVHTIVILKLAMFTEEECHLGSRHCNHGTPNYRLLTGRLSRQRNFPEGQQTKW